MTPLEIVSIALALSALLAALVRPKALPWTLGVAALSFVAALIMNPARWPLYPAIAALVFLATLLRRQAHFIWLSTLTSGALLAISAALAQLFALPVLPAPSGPHMIGTIASAIERPSRDGPRRLFLKLWYPANWTRGKPEGVWNDLAAMTDIPWYIRSSLAYISRAPTHSYAAAPYAAAQAAARIVLYNHSFISWASENSLLAEDLASRGFVVVAIRPLGQVDEYRRLESRGGGEIAEVSEMMHRRIEDNRVVVERLGDILRAIPGMTDPVPRTYQAIGFSLGGAVSTGLCTTDRNCLAVVNIDGAIPSIDYPHLPIPYYLMIYSGSNFARLGAVRRGAQAGYRELIFDQAVHADFHDSATLLPVTRLFFGRSVAVVERERKEIAALTAAFLADASGDGPMPPGARPSAAR